MLHTDTPRRRLLLTEVAQRLRVPLRRVLTWLQSRELRGIDVGSKAKSRRPRYVIDEQDLIDFEERRATAPATTRRATKRRTLSIPNYFSGSEVAS